MDPDLEKSRLADIFRRLGADDPVGWARSQVDEGIPQLARFAFLKDAWAHVLDEDDATWIDREIAAA